jgi:MSHA biogenesis protein MshP
MKRPQRGTSILIALFVIIVVASLAAFAVTVGGAAQQKEIVNLQAGRALAAARVGLEWAAYRIRGAGGSCVNQTLTLTEGALRGFQVNVTCTRSLAQHAESGGVTYFSYEVGAAASYGTFGTTDFAFRKLSARYFDPPY